MTGMAWKHYILLPIALILIRQLIIYLQGKCTERTTYLLVEYDFVEVSQRFCENYMNKIQKILHHFSKE